MLCYKGLGYRHPGDIYFHCNEKIYPLPISLRGAVRQPFEFFRDHSYQLVFSPETRQ